MVMKAFNEFRSRLSRFVLLAYSMATINGFNSCSFSSKDNSQNSNKDGYALLLSGASNNNCKWDFLEDEYIIEFGEIFKNLTDNGFDKENIFVLYNNGKPDFSSLDDNIREDLRSRFELDYSNKASIKNLEDIISRINELVDNDDIFVLYSVGDVENELYGESKIVLKNTNETINPKKLQNILKDINPGFGLIYIGSCNSGDFINIKKNNFVVVTASQSKREAISDNTYSFGRYFFSELVDSCRDLNNYNLTNALNAFNLAKKKFDEKQKEEFEDGWHPHYETFGPIEPQINYFIINTKTTKVD